VHPINEHELIGMGALSPKLGDVVTSARKPNAPLELLQRPQAEAIAAACGALAHPIRATVLAAVANGKVSPVQVARALNRSIAAVSHHFHVLEDAKLLRPAGTRPNRGTIEHFYALTSRGEALVALFGPIASAAGAERRKRR
jgi:DNA-binding transcriptional ArsR family regulator